MTQIISQGRVKKQQKMMSKIEDAYLNQKSQNKGKLKSRDYNATTTNIKSQWQKLPEFYKNLENLKSPLGVQNTTSLKSAQSEYRNHQDVYQLRKNFTKPFDLKMRPLMTHVYIHDLQTSKYPQIINKTNQLQPLGKNTKSYKFQIMPGNNSQLVRKVILATERSQYWQELPNITQGHFHFRWAPVSKQVNFERLSFNFTQMTNHLEGHNEISKKHELFKNLKYHLEINMEKPIYSLKQQLQQFKNIFFLMEEFKTKFDSDITDPVQLASYQNIIQQKQVTFISKKKDIQKQGAYFGQLLQQPSTAQILKSSQKSDHIMPLCHFKGKNVWILKPTSLNRGKGIHVISSFKKLKKLIRDYCQNENRGPILKHSSFIIQKYIEDPFLINKRKFDIRVWVLINQEQEVYFFRRYIADNKLKCDFDQDILPKMKYYAALSIESAKRKLNSSKRKQCFEIFGYDYIIDKDFNVWLIEANTNPCIEESSSILKVLIPRMLNDALKLTIDQVFPTLNKNLDDQVTSNGLELRTESLKQKIVHQSIDMNNLGHIDGINNYDIKNLIQSKKQLKKQQVSNGQIDINRKFETFSVPGYPDQINMWQISMHKTSFIQGEDIFNKVDWQ
ncbi:tubulin-tyrosine ligase family [Stylonychia lemnae]|uniref:Tubulin-tyrosine ligase family n=1 Tax=Stylonychia lemnae TaxID=5949 RepID=A0A078BC45_STYLE|nr:tubulin-tyrosine ligase family [Stylonychia lemnae]|eukprot:CDW91776.1 tubulin-tyrosine ligase family [Stylonychia lemnae]